MNNIKYFGMTLDNKLNLNNLTNIVRKFYYIFYEIRIIFNNKIKIIIYKFISNY